MTEPGRQGEVWQDPLARVMGDGIIGPAAKICYRCLYWLAQTIGKAEIAVTAADLGVRCGRSPRAAWDWLAELERHGLVAVADRDRRRGTVLVYVFKPYPGAPMERPDPQRLLEFDAGVSAQKPPSLDKHTGVSAQKPPADSIDGQGNPQVKMIPRTQPQTTFLSCFDMSSSTTEADLRDVVTNILRIIWPNPITIPALDQDAAGFLVKVAAIRIALPNPECDLVDAAARAVHRKMQIEPVKSPMGFFRRCLGSQLEDFALAEEGKGHDVLSAALREVRQTARYCQLVPEIVNRLRQAEQDHRETERKQQGRERTRPSPEDVAAIHEATKEARRIMAAGRHARKSKGTADE